MRLKSPHVAGGRHSSRVSRQGAHNSLQTEEVVKRGYHIIKKTGRKIPGLICFIVLVCLTFTHKAYAQTASDIETSKGITVTLELDKDCYRAGDAINYSITIENNRTNWYAAKFEIEYTNSEGILPVSSDSMPTTVEKLGSMEKQVLSGTLGANRELYDRALASQRLLDEEKVAAGETVEGVNDDVNSRLPEEKEKNTGLKNGLIIVLSVVAGVLVIFAVILLIKRGRIKKGTAVILIFALLTGSLTGSVEVNAADYETVNLRPYVSVLYGGEEIVIRAVLSIKMYQEKLTIAKENKDVAKTICCHDPSIFKDFDGTYYLFGTHIGFDRSTDLRNWTNLDAQFRAGFTAEEKAKIRAWNKDSNGDWFGYLWAPDVIYNPVLEKYCMYLSANGDDWKSNIVMLTADKAEGPYKYAGSVVYGGFTEEDFCETDVDEVLKTDTLPERYIKNGIKNKAWGDMWPNCIDPCVFYDGEGKLWMSYGSWSGGIFILKLDENTGLRDYGTEYPCDDHSDAYFGTKIAGGKYVSGEGSYIQKIGDYYYLFVSYGGLEAKGGYNIRVFRSLRPDGDYVDEMGNSPLYDKYILNVNQSVGVRLFGAYKWRNFNVAQVAQGHNSAFVDDDGRAYIIYHTRTNDGSEGHHVEVHQLFVNREGWLVAAPYHTNGEVLDSTGSTKEEIAGKYEIILHNLMINYKNLEYNRPESITLTPEGTITGDHEGTWEKEEGTPYITLVLDGVTYSGVELTMKLENTNIETRVFTALGKNQITLWGSKCIEN